MISYQNCYLVIAKTSKKTKIIVNLYYLLGIRLNALNTLSNLRPLITIGVCGSIKPILLKEESKFWKVEYLYQGE